MTTNAWRKNALWVVALVLDLILLVRLPEMGKSSGRYERDVISIAMNSFMAAVIIWTCLRLIRVGEPWQKVLGLTFIVLPIFVLVCAFLWARGYL